MSWYTTDELIANGTINPEIGKHLMRTCPTDGYPIVRNLQLTKAKCQNPYCPEHLAYRTDSLIKYLNILKSVGPRTIYDIICENHYTSPFEVLYYFTSQVSDKLFPMHLWEVAMFSGIEGMASTLREELGSYYTIDKYLAEAPNPLPKIVEKADEISRNCNFVNLKPPMSATVLNIMITGPLASMPREAYVRHVNEVVGQYIHVINKGVSKSCDLLITQYPDELRENIRRGTASRKAMAAAEAGTPIVSPDQFEDMLAKYVAQRVGEEERYHSYIIEKEKEGGSWLNEATNETS